MNIASTFNSFIIPLLFIHNEYALVRRLDMLLFFSNQGKARRRAGYEHYKMVYRVSIFYVSEKLLLTDLCEASLYQPSRGDNPEHLKTNSEIIIGIQ